MYSLGVYYKRKKEKKRGCPKMAQYEGFVTNWDGKKEYVNSKTWYSEIHEDLTLKQFKEDLRGNGYKFSDCYLVSCEKMAFANHLAEYYNVDLKEILKNYKLWSNGLELWIDNDGWVQHKHNTSEDIQIVETTENETEAAETTENKIKVKITKKMTNLLKESNYQKFNLNVECEVERQADVQGIKLSTIKLLDIVDYLRKNKLEILDSGVKSLEIAL